MFTVNPRERSRRWPFIEVSVPRESPFFKISDTEKYLLNIWTSIYSYQKLCSYRKACCIGNLAGLIEIIISPLRIKKAAELWSGFSTWKSYMLVELHEKALQRAPFSQLWSWAHPALALVALLPSEASLWLPVGDVLCPHLVFPLSIFDSPYGLFLCSDFLLHRRLSRFYWCPS